MFIKTEACTLLSHLKAYQKLSHAQLLCLLKLCEKGSLLFLTDRKTKVQNSPLHKETKPPNQTSLSLCRVL